MNKPEWVFTESVKGILHTKEFCNINNVAPYSRATRQDGCCHYCKKEVPNHIMLQWKLLHGTDTNI